MIQYLHCSHCRKVCSSAFIPEPTDTPDRGLIVRAFIECPECMRERFKEEHRTLDEMKALINSALDTLNGIKLEVKL